MRSTKTTQKLKILPNPDPGEDGPDEESGRDVYSQFTRIKDPTARRDAARLGKADRDRLTSGHSILYLTGLSSGGNHEVYEISMQDERGQS